MLLVTFRGNLGADVQAKVANGKEFYVFNVAVTKRFRGSDGVVKESTQWVSCSMTDCSEELRKYLVRGQQVVVVGDMSTRVFSSPKARAMVAGIDCHVRTIELCGQVAKRLQLITKDGIIFEPFTRVQCPAEAGLSVGEICRGSDGQTYQLREDGYFDVVVMSEENQPQ